MVNYIRREVVRVTGFYITSNKFSIFQTPVNYSFGIIMINNRNYNYLIYPDILSFTPSGADFWSTYKRIK